MRHLIGPALVFAALVLAACQPPPPTLTERDYPAWGFKASFPPQPSEAAKPT